MDFAEEILSMISTLNLLSSISDGSMFEKSSEISDAMGRLGIII
jgi:hypothetical protein